MVHATKFLLRWLYLNNLIHDRAEIQSLPYLHPSQLLNQNSNINNYHHDPQQHLHPQQQQQQQQQYQVETQSHSHHPTQNPPNHSQYQHPQQQPQQQPQQPQQQSINNNDVEWKRKALRKIALYPPGTSRLLALDSLRLEIVHELAKELHDADDIILDFTTRSSSSRSRNYNDRRDILYSNIDSNRNLDSRISGDNLRQIDRDITNNSDSSSNKSCNEEKHEDDGDDEEEEQGLSDYDNTLDLDVEVKDDDISAEFEKATSIKVLNENNNPTNIIESNNDEHNDNHVNKESNNYQSTSMASTTTKPVINKLDPKLKQALELQRETRDYLPQFVSAILHSPPPLTTSQNLNPISTLRKLLMDRCVRDPNLGIELCWLLEAEVGRTWKTLFEHRQQTGRRLILVLPADKAVVLAQIGSEKKSAFDLLQDVESATAFGYYGDDDDEEFDHRQHHDHNHNDYNHHEYYQHDPHHHIESLSIDKIYATPRLPESLSLKRCAHFGDTMNFIDQLTEISLKLRHVSLHHRKQMLHESLEELNRRLRRRMITEGSVSLDVEDNLGPYDWPSIGDISLESLKYSVHLPLEPTVSSF